VGATAKAHNWGNADLLPDIKVNTDAMARKSSWCRKASSKSLSEPQRLCLPLAPEQVDV
jgi:hypothetical protein